MFNWKGIVAGTLLYIAVELVLAFKGTTPPGGGVAGTDLVTWFHNINKPMFLVGLIVFWSLAGRFFEKVVVYNP